MFQFGDPVLLSVIIVLTLLMFAMLIRQIQMRRQIEKLQKEQTGKKAAPAPQPQKQTEREREGSRRDFERQLEDLQAKAEALLAEERLKADKALAELERQKEISKIASSVSKEQAQKIQFLTDIAQDLRNPVANLMHEMEQIQAGRSGKIPGRARRQIETMLRDSRQLMRLTNQFHDISNLQTGKMEINRTKQDVVHFVREIVQTVAWYAEKNNISLSFDTNVEQMQVLFDVQKMAEVFYHLISNAFKFSGENGKILISISSLIASEELEEDGVQIKIKNSGKAIPEEALPFIFDPFQRSDSNRPRFGLSLVKELVSLHGGSIKVRSEQDIGTEFTIVLPLGRVPEGMELVEQKTFDFTEQAKMELSFLELQERKPTQEPPVERVTAPPTAGNILIVEDNDNLREMLKGGLRAHYMISEAKNGNEAMVKVRETRPDLIITDLMMPEMDGLDFCRHVKRDPALNQIPVILITAKSTETGRLEGIEAGADAYIAKPFGFEELLRKVEHLTKQS